jgi:sugar phosphate isomerase/epimerase
MPRTTRRGFLAGTLAATTIPMTLGRPAESHARPIDPIGRTRTSHMKLSLAAYSFRELLDFKDPKMDMFGFVDFAADQALDAVEPTSYWFPPDVDAKYLRKLQQHAFLRGLDISGTAIRNDFCVPPPKLEAEVRGVRAWIDRAAELTAPVIRVFGGNVPRGENEDVVADRLVGAVESLLPYAVEKGVTLALENHGGITATPAQILRLVKAVKAPEGGFGVNLDTGNFHGDDPYAEIAELAPYAVNVQVKTEISRKGKMEEADLSKVVSILRDARYSGYVVLEYEAAEDPMVAVPRHLKKLRELIG